ncbi:MAG: metal-dependent hydrolase [Patescibacteria group bacterium]|jgi:hypothetical protein
MFLPTHLVAGMIIGKLTGDYTTSIIGSIFMDLDHLFSYYRAGFLFNFKKLFTMATSRVNIGIPQRNYFHNIFFCLAVSVILMIINFSVGLIFFTAYIFHLILDSLDDSNYYPIYPNKKIRLHGPIKYFSKQEIVIVFVLLLIFFSI